MVSLNDIPAETRYHIFQYFNVFELTKLSQVCKTFKLISDKIVPSRMLLELDSGTNADLTCIPEHTLRRIFEHHLLKDGYLFIKDTEINVPVMLDIFAKQLKYFWIYKQVTTDEIQNMTRTFSRVQFPHMTTIRIYASFSETLDTSDNLNDLFQSCLLGAPNLIGFLFCTLGLAFNMERSAFVPHQNLQTLHLDGPRAIGWTNLHLKLPNLKRLSWAHYDQSRLWDILLNIESNTLISLFTRLHAQILPEFVKHFTTMRLKLPNLKFCSFDLIGSGEIYLDLLSLANSLVDLHPKLQTIRFQKDSDSFSLSFDSVSRKMIEQPKIGRMIIQKDD